MNDLKEIGFYSLSNERCKNSSLTSQMKRCELIITEYCNFRCPYCRGLKSEIYGNRKVKQLTLDEIKQYIDYWCENTPLENIRFSGGEPTLHPNIKEVIAYAKFKGINRIAISIIEERGKSVSLLIEGDLTISNINYFHQNYLINLMS